MENSIVTTAGSLIVGDVFALMIENSSHYEVIEHTRQAFGPGITMTLKSLKDGICRQANWHEGNLVSLIHTNFIPEPCDDRRTLAEILETAL